MIQLAPLLNLIKAVQINMLYVQSILVKIRIQASAMQATAVTATAATTMQPLQVSVGH